MNPIILLNPPSPPGRTANREGSGGMGVLVPEPNGFFYPPQTLAYAGAVLLREGLPVRGIDAVAEKLSDEQTINRIPSGKHLIVCYTSAKTLAHDLEFCRSLSSAKLDATVLLAGTALSYFGADSFTAFPDTLLLQGEVPYLLPDAVKAWAEGSIENAPGVVRARNAIPGKLVPSGPPASLPRPAWYLFPHYLYPFLTLQGSWGCDHNCRYCPYVLGMGKPRRSRLPADVADELAWLTREFPKPRYMLRDPAPAADGDWFMALAREIHRRRVRAPWECESRPEHLNAELLRELRRAGCSVLKLGVESADGRLLQAWGRLLPGWDPSRYLEHTAKIIQTCRRLGIVCRAFVMIGLPGETEESLQKTVDFLKATRPALISVKRFMKYPGQDLPSLPPSPVSEERLAQFESEMANAAVPLRVPLPRKFRAKLGRLARKITGA